MKCTRSCTTIRHLCVIAFCVYFLLVCATIYNLVQGYCWDWSYLFSQIVNRIKKFNNKTEGVSNFSNPKVSSSSPAFHERVQKFALHCQSTLHFFSSNNGFSTKGNSAIEWFGPRNSNPSKFVLISMDIHNAKHNSPSSFYNC